MVAAFNGFWFWQELPSVPRPGVEPKQKGLTSVKPFLVAGSGVEPETFGLWIQRSNHLSYPAVFTLSVNNGVQKYKKLAFREIFISPYDTIIWKNLAEQAGWGQKMIGEARFNTQNLLLQPKFIA